MKKIVTIFIVLVMLALAVPANAMGDHDCPHHGPTIEQLRNCVLHALDAGHISKGVANGLLSKINEAESSFNAGQYSDAIGSLNAFINQVNAQTGKAIQLMHADHMIGHAEAVIAQIRGLI